MNSTPEPEPQEQALSAFYVEPGPETADQRVQTAAQHLNRLPRCLHRKCDPLDSGNTGS